MEPVWWFTGLLIFLVTASYLLAWYMRWEDRRTAQYLLTLDELSQAERDRLDAILACLKEIRAVVQEGSDERRLHDLPQG